MDGESKAAWAAGGMVFAAVSMIMMGVWQAIEGIFGIATDNFYAEVQDYVVSIDTTAWGWIHLILGVVTALVGCALFGGATWARVLGVVLACLVLINNFLYLPYYPFWSLLIIALAIFSIWAMTVAPKPTGPDYR
ncbi:hypothetical protein [Glycomyces algeriensis]|uniref:DUF7144 domain-containing protein n=1 Tax=Glycomyces algeriensis TaxID=256037 RepID=A0A9W6GBP1_9ACTN|nr:hypothetical protein [Glycomyces algeriensis]MDA1365483.1 hypothetical protein [Glycomyces algeriensis]MDR7351169.1 hypothetical protein [Glycomyces algeriensis]GLI43882.1 hypothetical protein GALLR39Z86_37320 [Glycomyces algeriensis]